MTRLADRLTVWGPCIWLATCGGLLDYFRHFWGPGVLGGALIGFFVGRERWRAQRRDRALRARLTDGLNGLPQYGPWDEKGAPGVD
ncbi:hypothetical protein OR37_03439 [Caulobacter vibrioides OR37]|jgi:hypothetical protein|uniref:Uncharacterized protein n=1 Tax=Caulobacter vibrioides OR37 TaxID=1292034 RepID=R0CW63_CAUVI|nr:hypothetical protein OR37_03439 [Caulobacter vibrioides OR37]